MIFIGPFLNVGHFLLNTRIDRLSQGESATVPTIDTRAYDDVQFVKTIRNKTSIFRTDFLRYSASLFEDKVIQV